MAQLIQYFLHIDRYLSVIVTSAGAWSYAILFLIIFCETGLVVTPFLPGDSLLFAAGSLTAVDGLNLPALLATLFIAAVVGDGVNYWIGREAGLRLLQGPLARFINPRYLDRAQQFYAKHGAKAIVLARFVPIVRTFAPFVAGIGRMEYRRFALYNVIGAAAWVFLFTVGGALFGNIPAVKKNFSVVILVIIVLSVMPPFIEWWKLRKVDRSNQS